LEYYELADLCFCPIFHRHVKTVMAISSATVVGNSLLLGKYDPKKSK
jgi:hypothetical protein